MVPYPSAVVETFGLPYVQNVEVPAEGHRDFLFRRRVYEYVLAELRAGDQPAPVPLSRLRLVPAGPPPPAGGALQTG